MRNIKETSSLIDKNRANIALFIDCENANAKAIDKVLDSLSKEGAVNIRNAYADWNDKLIKPWREVLNKHSITPVQQFSYVKGKNVSDIAMCIDAMEVMYTKKIDAFAFMTSDSDFTPLAQRLRNNSITVFGFGESKTPESFINACNHFISTDIENQIIDTETIELINVAIEYSMDDDEFANVAEIGKYLSKRSSTFNVENYGYKKLGQLLKDMKDNFECKYENSTLYAKIKRGSGYKPGWKELR